MTHISFNRLPGDTRLVQVLPKGVVSFKREGSDKWEILGEAANIAIVDDPWVGELTLYDPPYEHSDDRSLRYSASLLTLRTQHASR
jgi:hypothetical protein